MRHRSLAIYSDDVSSLDVSAEAGLVDVSLDDRQASVVETPPPAEIMAG